MGEDVAKRILGIWRLDPKFVYIYVLSRIEIAVSWNQATAGALFLLLPILKSLHEYGSALARFSDIDSLPTGLNVTNAGHVDSTLDDEELSRIKKVGDKN